MSTDAPTAQRIRLELREIEAILTEYAKQHVEIHQQPWGIDIWLEEDYRLPLCENRLGTQFQESLDEGSPRCLSRIRPCEIYD